MKLLDLNVSRSPRVAICSLAIALLLLFTWKYLQLPSSTSELIEMVNREEEIWNKYKVATRGISHLGTDHIASTIGNENEADPDVRLVIVRAYVLGATSLKSNVARFANDNDPNYRYIQVISTEVLSKDFEGKSDE